MTVSALRVLSAPGTNIRSTRWTVQDTLLFALALAYPFHFSAPTSVDVINVSVGDAVVALVLFGFALSLAGRVALPSYVKPVAAFLLVAVGSLTYPLLSPTADVRGVSLAGGLLEMVKFVGGAGWMVAVYALVRRHPVRGLRVFAGASTIVASLFALGTMIQSLLYVGTRPSGPFENENLYANYLALNLFLLLSVLSFDPQGERPLRFGIARAALIPILLVGILATGSRGALIGVLVALPISVRWRFPRRLPAGRIVAIVVTVTLTAGAAWAFWSANPFIAERVGGLLAGEGPNIDVRLALWSAAIQAFLTAPVLGIGYHQFPAYGFDATALSIDHPKVAHNTYLEVAAELGVVGLIVFAWLVFAIIRDAVRLSHSPRFAAARFLTAAIIATLVQGLFANVEHYRSLWIVAGLVAAMRSWGVSRASAS